MTRHVTLTVFALLVTSSGVATVIFAPALASATIAGSSQGIDLRGLSIQEALFLWSGDHDTAEEPQLDIYEQVPDTEEYQQAVRLARATDRTYQTPPSTAAKWTRNTFEGIPGSRFSQKKSISPSDASTTDEGNIRDAHATTFHVQPSTIVHRGQETTRYIAPEGRFMAVVDYRVREKSGSVDENPPGEDILYREVSWDLREHTIEGEWLYADGEQVGKKTTGYNLDGKPSHTPTFTYDLSGKEADELTVEAEIVVKYEKTVVTKKRIKNPVQNPTDNDTEYITIRDVETSIVTDKVTVSDTVDVEVYDLSESVKGWTADLPDGDAGYAVYAEKPWTGYRVTAQNSLLKKKQTHTVYSGWKFFTARDRSWDSLTVEASGENREVTSMIRPVSVHAFPAKEKSETDPDRFDGGPRVTKTWGPSAPGTELKDEFNVEATNNISEQTAGIASHHSSLSDGKPITVLGIVRGTETKIDSGLTSREVHPTNLTLTAISNNATHTTLRVTLRDNRTGDRIPLREEQTSRYTPLADDWTYTSMELGRIVILHPLANKEWVVTPSNGTAVLTVRETGEFEAVFHPASWTVSSPGYTPARTSTKAVSWYTFGGVLPMLWSAFLVFFPVWFAWRASSGFSNLFNSGVN